MLLDQNDDQTDAARDYKVVTSMNVAGGTSPTAHIFIQGSLDAQRTQRQAAGSFREILEPANVSLLPWIRAGLVLGGTANPNLDVTVELVSTGGFQLATS